MMVGGSLDSDRDRADDRLLPALVDVVADGLRHRIVALPPPLNGGFGPGATGAGDDPC
jgi:hypothetical protein